MPLPCRLAAVAFAAALVACSSNEAPPIGPDASGDAPKDAAAGDAPDRDAADGAVTDGGTPRLVELGVTGPTPPDGASPLSLVPPFSPTVYDYYVRCGAGANALSVSMKASPGAGSLVLLPAPSGEAPAQTVAMTVTEGQAIVAAATDGKTTTEYWVRCLPHDFPHLQMTAHPEAGAPTPGYYLVGNLVAQPGATHAYAMILDVRGVPLWYTPQAVGLPVYDVDSVVEGGVSFAFPFQVQVLSPYAQQLVTVVTQPPDEHELVRLPNGHYLVLWAAIQGGVDLSGLVVPQIDGGPRPLGPNESIIACDIFEVDPFGTPVWAWFATDHFDPVKDMTFLQPSLLAPDGGPLTEPFHCNSIDVDESGNLLVSARHMDSIFYVEKATGKVLWKMGGRRASKDNATYVPVASPFFRQHDARFLPGWKSSCATGRGQIALFDDQTELDAAARAVVYDVNIAPRDGGAADCGSASDGSVTGASLAWQYAGDANVQSMGSFRVMPDGTRLIGWGSSWGTGTAPAFTELDDAGRAVLDFAFTDGNTTYRAIKVPTTAFDLAVLRAAAGH